MQKIALLLSIVSILSLQTLHAQFSEDFENGIPGTWSLINGGDSNTWFAGMPGDGTANSGNNVMRIDYNTTIAHDDHLITPSFTVTAGISDQLTLYYKHRSDAFPEPFDILLSTTGNNANDFTTTIAAQVTPNTTWQQGTFNLSAYVGSTVYISFYSATVDRWELYLDDVTIDGLPTCSAPTNLTASNITNTSADLQWTEFATATAWDIELVDITAGGTASGTVTFNDVMNPHTISSLNDNNEYAFYVRADCGMDNIDVSSWAGPFTFMTDCNAINSFPYCEGFDSFSSFQSCWSVNDANADGVAWDLNYTFGYNSGDEVAMIRTEANLGANDDYLISPKLSLTGGEQLRYFYRVQSPVEPNEFEVLLSTTGTDPADFTTTLLPLTTYNNNTYKEKIISLNNYTGEVYIAFHVPNGTLDGWRIYIDDVCVEPIPSCPPPYNLAATNITDSTAIISWTEFASATVWDVAVIDITAGGSFQGTITHSNVTNPDTIVNLVGYNEYDFYVRADCSLDNGMVSPWVGSYSFITSCDTVNTFPYCENFNSTSTLDSCWVIDDNNQDGDTWDVHYPSNGNEAAAIITDGNNGDNDDYLISPSLNLNGQEQLRYSYKVDDATDPDLFQVLLSTTGTYPADFTTILSSSGPITNTSFIEETIDLSAYTGHVHIAFFVPIGTLDGSIIYIDDICIEDISSCPDDYANGGMPNSQSALTGPLDMNADYETDGAIISDQVIGGITSAIGVDYDAGTDVLLNSGFEVKVGVEFDAFIDGCDNGTGGNQ